MLRSALAAIAASIPTALFAACDGETIVSCETGGGRHLEVCLSPGDFSGHGGFSYRFGPAGAPEIALSVPLSAGTVTPWSGFSRAIWSAVRFPNAEYEYEVWHSFDRLDEAAVLEAGVNVLRDDRSIAALTCQPGGEIAPLFTLENSMAGAGYCWDRGTSSWQRTNCG